MIEVESIKTAGKSSEAGATSAGNHWCESCGGEGCGFCKGKGTILNGSCFSYDILAMTAEQRKALRIRKGIDAKESK